MRKITYLFGAGASSATIPIARMLGKDIGLTARAMEKDKGTSGKEMLEDLDWLCNTAKNHYTIDTIARTRSGRWMARR